MVYVSVRKSSFFSSLFPQLTSFSCMLGSWERSSPLFGLAEIGSCSSGISSALIPINQELGTWWMDHGVWLRRSVGCTAGGSLCAPEVRARNQPLISLVWCSGLPIDINLFVLLFSLQEEATYHNGELSYDVSCPLGIASLLDCSISTSSPRWVGTFSHYWLQHTYVQLALC